MGVWNFPFQIVPGRQLKILLIKFFLSNYPTNILGSMKPSLGKFVYGIFNMFEVCALTIFFLIQTPKSNSPGRVIAYDLT